MRATDGGNRISHCLVTVHVSDINDNSPVFVLPHSDRLSVRERQPIGTEVSQFAANDADSGPNGTVTYIVDDKTHFMIDEKTGVLATATVLSRAESSSYRIIVTASDHGIPPRTVTRTVTVDVLDVPDSNKNSSIMEFSVAESAPLGTLIGRLDSTHYNAENMSAALDVEYSILSGNQPVLFDIDKRNGALYIAASLDYEKASVHVLRVLKRAQNAVDSYVTVRISVEDENDNAPVFEDADPLVLSVQENARLNTKVWTFNASDGDMGANGRIMFDLIAAAPTSAAFRLDRVTGELLVASALDRETVSEYVLVIGAADQPADRRQQRHSRLTVRVYVADMNDNRPRFVSADSAHLSLASVVAPFHHIVAVDDDWQENARVAYRIVSGNNDGLFALNESTGALTVTRHLPRSMDGQVATLNWLFSRFFCRCMHCKSPQLTMDNPFFLQRKHSPCAYTQ